MNVLLIGQFADELQRTFRADSRMSSKDPLITCLMARPDPQQMSRLLFAHAVVTDVENACLPRFDGEGTDARLKGRYVLTSVREVPAVVADLLTILNREQSSPTAHAAKT